MIVKNTNNGWKIITQTGHAFLAAQLAQNLAEKYKRSFWLETLLAVYNHETLETDFNSGSILNSKGMPLDFRESKVSKAEVVKKIDTMVETVAYRSTIVNALITRHLKFLHEDIFEKHKDKYDTIIETALENYKIKKAEFENMYSVLQFTDRLSLIICCDELPKTDRKIEINNVLNGESIFISNQEEKYVISPWPFNQKEISVYNEFRNMKSASFSNEKEFMEEYHNMKIESYSYSFNSK